MKLGRYAIADLMTAQRSDGEANLGDANDLMAV